jgi:hypothetical protein
MANIPRILARLVPDVFECPELQFVEAIPVGRDLSLVWPRFAVWLLVDPQDGVITFARTDRQRTEIQNVADAYGRQLDGNAPPQDRGPAGAVYAAAAAAFAVVAAGSGDADAAVAAAEFAAGALGDADDGTLAYVYAAEAADAADAKRAIRQRQAQKLLELCTA